MRLSEPRIPPLHDKTDWDDDVRHIIDPKGDRDAGEVYNIFKTLAHHPKLMKRWVVFANHILMKSSLPAREREILILRIGWLCRSEYEWTQHVRIGRAEAEMSDADFKAIEDGPDSAHWSPLEAALVRAVDELHRDAFMSDATWRELSQHFSRPQMMDIVATVGNYNLVSMMLNSFGVQVDDWLERYEGFPQS